MTTADAAPPKPRWSFFGEVHGWRAFVVNFAAAVIAAASDPNFTGVYNISRLILTFATVFIILNYGGALVRKMWGSRPSKGYRPKIVARPVNLLFLVASVGFAQITHIEPAMILGAALALEASDSEEVTHKRLAARATIAGAVYNLTLGVGAWLLYSVVAVLPAESIGSVFGLSTVVSNAQVIVGEFLAALTIAALSALPLSLMPLRFLEGFHLWRWNRIGWAIVYVIASTVYAFVLISLPQSWSEISVPFLAWIGVYIAYVVLAFGVWAYFRFTKARIDG